MSRPDKGLVPQNTLTVPHNPTFSSPHSGRQQQQPGGCSITGFIRPEFHTTMDAPRRPKAFSITQVWIHADPPSRRRVTRASESERSGCQYCKRNAFKYPTLSRPLGSEGRDDTSSRFNYPICDATTNIPTYSWLTTSKPLEARERSH